MIKVNGPAVEMMGPEEEILSDLTLVLHTVYKITEKMHGKENARTIIADIGRIALMNDEDMFKVMEEESWIEI